MEMTRVTYRCVMYR